jgi:transposase-like protein
MEKKGRRETKERRRGGRKRGRKDRREPGVVVYTCNPSYWGHR